MKRFLLTLLAFSLVIALAALVLAPVAFRQYRLWENANAVSGYREATARLSPPDEDALFSQAQTHNEALRNDRRTDPSATEPTQPDTGEEYASLLNPGGNGVMAVLDLPKLGATLAVYHGGEIGASEPRVTHVPESRLPTGSGTGPCVLRATRDRFFDPFTGLERLMVGDCFCLYVLNETLTYEVSQVGTASPQDLDSLQGDGSEEECVLAAAAPDAREEQRLVVRGHRVSRHNVKPVDDSRALPAGIPELIFGIPVAVVGLFMLMVTEWLRRSARRRMRRRMKL